MKSRLLCLVVFASCLAGSSILPAAQPNDASVIMGKVAAAYAAAISYEDSGVVLIHDPRKEQPDEIVFQTIFLRPDLLRFDWITHHPYPPLRHVKTSWSIWPDGNGSHFMVMGSDKPKPARSLNECVQGAMGVSRSSSHHIPRLLTSAITGFALVDLADLRLLGEELFEGVRCHRLQGAHPRRGVYQLWVGQTDFLIRRIMIEGSTVPPTEEIHREIRINGEISPGALQGKR